jgi:rare lipoprotein A (peptidoglycan hydrolase)
MTCALPDRADAAPKEDAPAKNRVAKNVDRLSAKTSKSSVQKSKKISDKKTRSVAEKSKKGKKKRVARTGASRADSRKIWLKRAGESDMATGKASWYGDRHHGGETASGLNYDMFTFTAAHRTLPIGTIVKVTDQGNGKSVMVCITDRGPYVRGRIIDLSYAAAKQIDLGVKGVSHVNLDVVSDTEGRPLRDDEAFYVRYNAALKTEKAGPFNDFADAVVMHEALYEAHPDAEVVIGSK